MGSRHSVEYRTDPVVAQQLAATRADLEKARLESRQAREAAALEMKELQATIKKIQEDADRNKKRFNDHIQKAKDIVQGCKDGEGVVVLLGAQGSGKTTLCKFLLKIRGAAPMVGDGHGTTELQKEHSSAVGLTIVDTIGKMPDVRGMMRVLACVYNKGWNPTGLIAVHTGRLGHFDKAASFLQASKVNVIDFSPVPFWKMIQNGLDVGTALKMTMKEVDANASSPLPHVHAIGYDGGELNVAECHITESLLPALSTLTWDSLVSAREDAGIANSLAYYLAKSIAERADFEGSDLEFIDRE